MRVSFPSENSLTWQGQREYTSLMDSTHNPPNGASSDPSDRERSFGTSTNQVVYFLGTENGLVKIGFASNFNDRYGRLCGGSPLPLTPLAIVRGGRVEERAYHARFKPWKHHAEWFYLTDELEEEIDRINYEQTPNHIPVRFRGGALPLTLTKAAL